LAAYRAALAAPGDGALAAALERNVFGGAAAGEAALRLAGYMRETTRRLAAQDGFVRSELAFPDPEQAVL
jgi:hypothetical protein